MKILIIPSLFITDFKSRNLQLFKTFFKKNIINREFMSLKDIQSHFFSAEHYNYSNIVKLNGKDDTFILGNYYSEYTTNVIPYYTRYPSSHSSEKATHLNLKGAYNILDKIDCILIGIKSVEYFNSFLKKAKKKNILISFLDYYDDPDIYKIEQISENRLTRNYVYRKDFDIFFKHDIPVNYYKKYLFSICPMPINFENYPTIKIKSFNEKEFNISFSGRKHNKDHPERSRFVDFLSNKISNFKINFLSSHEKIPLKNYCTLMNNSKIAFSPSGKVWDSTRHTECAIYKNVPLIKKPNCLLSNNFEVNENNSIIYDLNNEKSYKNVLERINFVLNNEDEFNKVSSNWHNEVLNKCTLLSRSKFILNTIQDNLNV